MRNKGFGFGGDVSSTGFAGVKGGMCHSVLYVFLLCWMGSVSGLGVCERFGECVCVMLYER